MAALAHDLDGVERALASGAHPDGLCSTPPVVAQLMDPDRRPLMHGAVACVKALVAAGATVPDEALLSLFWAPAFFDADLARQLVDAGVNPLAPVPDRYCGGYLFTNSCVASCPVKMRFLLDRGAGAIINRTNMYGTTVMHAFSWSPPFDAALFHMLVDAGADITPRMGTGATILHRLALDLVNGMHDAMPQDTVAIIRTAVSRGLDVNDVGCGMTPLSYMLGYWHDDMSHRVPASRVCDAIDVLVGVRADPAPGIDRMLAATYAPPDAVALILNHLRTSL